MSSELARPGQPDAQWFDQPRPSSTRPETAHSDVAEPFAPPQDKSTRRRRFRAEPRRHRADHYRVERGTLYVAIAFLVLIVCGMKIYTLEQFNRNMFWAVYSLTVTTYILSRFVLAACYHPRHTNAARVFTPRLAIIVPAYNEPEAISYTLHTCLGADYPHDLLQVIVVDDKSTDETLSRIDEVKAEHPELTVIASPVNEGKRHAMARGLAAAPDAEVVVFIDSDSMIDPGAVRKLVAYFNDPEVGAVAGHTDVWNRDSNLLTRMQAVRYYVAFKVYKSAEALFGSVMCCSGCFSGYRRSAVDGVLDLWLRQSFLGQPSTYGDDRSLTNYLLQRKWKVLYAPEAQAYTNVPDRLNQFLRQQLRWKKSWVRESLRAGSFMWRRHPIMSLSFYLGIALPLLAPQVAFRAFVIQPHFTGSPPYWYMAGVVTMALLYGLYYRVHNRERLWFYGVFFALFYTGVLVWQLPYALATIRDSKWGTR